MRSLRVSLTGTVLLALLGGLSSVMVAQEDEGSVPVSATYVSGLRTWTGSGTGGEGHYVMDMGDPRVNGAFTESDFAGPEYPVALTFPATARMVRLRLENDEGSWERTFSGMEYEPPERDFYTIDGWLSGDGAYAGYTFYLQVDASQYGGPTRSFHGVIFKGQPPLAPTE